MPKVSVIMGIYNTPKREYLEKSINSILNQTFKDFEFIICDDGSNNDCLKWAKEICKDDTRCIFLKNDQNRGLAYTLNHCLQVAKGEYIARMDDDDESMLDRLQKQVDFLENNPDYSVVSANASIFDDNGIYKELKYNEIVKKEDFLFNNPIIHPVVLIRKSAYDKVENYRDIKNTVRVEDYDLFLRMFYNNLKMYIIQENLINYRQDKNSAKKKKFKYRINEVKVRYEGFTKLGLLKNKKNYIYVVKPIVVGIMPLFILKRFKNKRKGN